METETENDIVKLEEKEMEQKSRQIKSDDATCMQVTSNTPFNLFLTAKKAC